MTKNKQILKALGKYFYDRNGQEYKLVTSFEPSIYELFIVGQFVDFQSCHEDGRPSTYYNIFDVYNDEIIPKNDKTKKLAIKLFNLNSDEAVIRDKITNIWLDLFPDE